jgi:lipopolysaccharide biosynthesis glycosyltransferase
MNELIKVVIGFDQRESVAYHTFCQSILQKTSVPVSFMPILINSLTDYKETHTDGSNSFIYSRFLTPHLNNYEGWAIFADGDMICLSDIKELWNLRDENKALMVVKHEYETKVNIKYLGNKNENYPRKNWSSVILWNCGHPKHKILTPQFISNQSGQYLHRFSWLNEDEIGELPKEWNWLAIEYPENPNAKLIHYTLGTPCFNEYKDTSMADHWHRIFKKTIQGFN